MEKPVVSADDVGEAVAAGDSTATEGAPNAWPDESAEASMMSELRTRGELATPAAAEAVEETDTKNLPPMDELVKRIPSDVREALDDLFRVKFVRVTRVPAKALKS